MNDGRRALAASLLAATLLTLSACASPPLTRPNSDAPTWRGRLGLRLDREQPQSFFASFELSGNARLGELRLFSPLGSTLAQLQWTEQLATLRQNDQTQIFDSVDALLAQVTGTALPIAALFEWLAGVPATVHGWQADLTQLDDGKLLARRTQPQPLAELRLILER